MLEAILARLLPYRWLAIAVILAGLGVGLVRTGYDMADARRVADVAALKQASAEARAAADEAARQKLQAAQARGDALTASLVQIESALDAKSQEESRAIARNTTGRACLSAGAVRLLNGADAPAARADMPEAAGGPAATDGAAATDHDVASWIANARKQYDTCRARLDALIDFGAGAP